MNCEHVAHAASDYVDRKLGLRGQFGVWMHLLVCSACKAYVQQVRLAKVALRTVRGTAEPAEPANMDALMASFRAESKKRPSDS